MTKLTEKQKLRLLTDIELSKNFLIDHKWTKGVEFRVDRDEKVVSACAIGAIRGGIYNGHLDLPRAGWPSLVDTVGVTHDPDKTKKTYEERYVHVQDLLDWMAEIRTKGEYHDIVSYNDKHAKRKRDVISLFDSASKAVAEDQVCMNNSIIDFVEGSVLARKLNKVWDFY